MWVVVITIIVVIVLIILMFSRKEEFHNVHIKNSCDKDIYIGSLSTTSTIPNNGGWKLSSGETSTVTLPDQWQGRFWGRTGCSFDGNKGKCDTGDCGGILQCNGAGGNPPATLAEFTFDSGPDSTVDFYDVSAVDGYNLPVTISPIHGTYVINDPTDKFQCTTQTWKSDPNKSCPEQLQVKNSSGKVVGCLSPCKAGLSPNDLYCCDTPYNCSPHSASCNPGQQICDPTKFPVKYTQVIKDACEQCYSYPYDDPTSTFTCNSTPTTKTNYNIEFCGIQNGPFPPDPPSPPKPPTPPNPPVVKPGLCSDGVTYCNPMACQCCPDGGLCPGTDVNSMCPGGRNPCSGSSPPSPPTPPVPPVNKPGLCSDGKTMCDPRACQCCPDGGLCPGTDVGNACSSNLSPCPSL